MNLKNFSLAFVALGGLAACQTYEPEMYAGLRSSPLLRPNSQDRTGRVPYSYGSETDLRRYTSFVVDPVLVYGGEDGQFEGIDDAEKAELADYMKAQFDEKLNLRSRPPAVGPGATMRIRLTLTGAKKNTPVLGTLSRVDIAGGLYNGVQAVRGREGSMTGSVIYAVELYDAASNKLLAAYVTKQYPNALNIASSVRPLDAAKAGIEKGAESFADQLRV